MTADLALSTTKHLSEQTVKYSASLWYSAATLSNVHWVWKAYIKGKTYGNPDNWMGLAAGHTIDFFIGDNVLLKLPAFPFLIGSRFLDLFEQEDALIKSYQKWKKTLKGTQPICYKSTNDHGRFASLFFSNYTIYWIKSKSYNISIRTQRIFGATLKMTGESFKLLMRLMDIVEMITIDPAKWRELASQGVKEGGVHIPKCLYTLSRNKDIFIRRLQSHEKGINSALKLLGAKKLKADDMIDNVRYLFSYTEKGLDVYKKTSEMVGQSLVNLFKKFVYDWSPKSLKQLMVDTGIAPKKNKWFKKQKNSNQSYASFPPSEIISLNPNFWGKQRKSKSPVENKTFIEPQARVAKYPLYSSDKKKASPGQFPPMSLISIPT